MVLLDNCDYCVLDTVGLEKGKRDGQKDHRSVPESQRCNSGGANGKFLASGGNRKMQVNNSLI